MQKVPSLNLVLDNTGLITDIIFLTGKEYEKSLQDVRIENLIKARDEYKSTVEKMHKDQALSIGKFNQLNDELEASKEKVHTLEKRLQGSVKCLL